MGLELFTVNVACSSLVPPAFSAMVLWHTGTDLTRLLVMLSFHRCYTLAFYATCGTPNVHSGVM